TPLIIDAGSKLENYIHVGVSLPPLAKGAAEMIVDPKMIQTSMLIDEGFRNVSWSPTGLSITKRFIKRIHLDMTPLIKENVPNEGDELDPYHTLIMNWSKRIHSDDFRSSTSLLGLGHKGGGISLWNYHTEKGMDYLTTFYPHKSYINFIKWTTWRRENDKSSIVHAYVVSTCMDGTVALSHVELTISGDASIQGVKAERLEVWFEGIPGTATLLEVFDDFNEDSDDMCIAVSRCTYVCFLQLSLEKNHRIVIRKDWIEKDLVYSDMGLAAGYWTGKEQFQCYTFEGEGHVYELTSMGIVEENEPEHAKINRKLLHIYSQQWMEEQTKAEEDDTLSIVGANPFVWGVSGGPSHLSATIFYQYDSQNDSYVTYILCKERGKENHALYAQLKKYVVDPDFFFYYPLKGVLHEVLEYLIHEDDYSPLETWFETLLAYTHDESKLNFTDTKGLTRAIYSEPSTIAARIIINAEIALKNYKVHGEFENKFKRIYLDAKKSILTHFLSCMLHHSNQLFETNSDDYNDTDIMNMLLLLDFSLTWNDEPLKAIALPLYKKIELKFPELNLEDEIQFCESVDEESEEFEVRPREPCPVCSEPVHIFKGTNMSQCQSGHFWEICSITRRVLHSPQVRKCTNCQVKTLRPLEDDTSFTNTILTYCWKCIYCCSEFIDT
ncbi:hypothetical protein K501DRAFT_187044, partial [Backusella circina FSU 941]